MTHAVMLGHADWQLVLNVTLANAALDSVASKPLIPCADLPLDLMILTTTALATLETVQRMYMSRMALRVTITAPTSSQENARLTMNSVRDTFELVSAYTYDMYMYYIHTQLKCVAILL